MKLIDDNPHLVRQRLFDLFTRWINDVRSTQEIRRESKTVGFLSKLPKSLLFTNLRFDEGSSLIFEQKAVDEKVYYNATCGVILTLLISDKEGGWFAQDPSKKEAQLISVSLDAGYLIPEQASELDQKIRKGSSLCEVIYLLSKEKCIRIITVNGIDIENLPSMNQLPVSRAILSFLDFVTFVVEENQEYDRFVTYDPVHSSIWMKKDEVLS